MGQGGTAADAGDRLTPSLRSDVVGGAAWTTVSQGIRLTLQVGLQLLLARLLGPGDFGLLAQAMVFIGFATLFSDLGVEAALVQRRTTTPGQLDAAFWLVLLVSSAIGAAIALGSGLIADLYGEPDLVDITRSLAVVLPLGALATVPRAVLLRRLRFRPIAVTDIGATVLGAVVAVVASQAGAGAWALVLNALVTTTVTSVGLLVASRWRPGRPQLGEARSFVRFSGYLAAFNTVNYWNRSADNLLVGRSLGAAALGVYSRGYSLMLLPISQISWALGRVMLPTLSRMQDDPERLRWAYRRAVGAVSVVALPATGLLFALAPQIEDGLLGSSWDGVAPILRILALVAAAQVITTTTTWIYQALGRTDLLFAWGLVSAVVTVGGFVVGVGMGSPRAVAVSYLVTSVAILGWPSVAIPLRLVRMRAHDLLSVVAAPAAATAVMAGTAAAVAALVPQPLVALVAATAAGGVAYLGLLAAVRPAAVTDLLAVLRPGADPDAGSDPGAGPVEPAEHRP